MIRIRQRAVWFLLFFIVSATLAVSCKGPYICSEVGALPEDLSWAVLGNSVFHYNSTTCQYVAGNLSLNLDKRIPSYARDMARLSGGRTTDIVHQYANAMNRAIENGTTLSTVIFDGCSNDIIFEQNGACRDLDDQDCQDLIAGEVQVFSELVDEMITDGVGLIVYVGMYEFQGIWTVYNPAIAYALDMIKQICDDKGIGFVDLKPYFSGKYNQYLMIDRMHPNYLGSQAIADAIAEYLDE